MKNIMIVLLSFFTLVSCNGQTKNEKDKKETEISKEVIKPKIDYKVDKEYDENGNLIRYDSTYTYYYSNMDKDAMMKDSIFKKFNEHFNNIEEPFGSSFYDDFFIKDNYKESEFFKEDFFRQNFKRNQEMMNKMMQRMDSLKNKFFIEEFPLEEGNKETKEKN